jgi:hypothetical protein
VFHWRKLHERGKLGEALVPNLPPKLMAVRDELLTLRHNKIKGSDTRPATASNRAEERSNYYQSALHLHLTLRHDYQQPKHHSTYWL